MNQAEKARGFAAMHRPGNPIVLFNIWDVGSARAVARAGARAIATNCWALANAHGVKDAADVPFYASLHNLKRILHAVDLPVTHDFCTGASENLVELADNFDAIVAAGAVGVNICDSGLGVAHDMAAQCERIATLRQRAGAMRVPVFINIRTRLFFDHQPAEVHASLLNMALERAHAYAAAGADGIFVPGLLDHDVIERLCAQSPLHVNVMQPGEFADIGRLACLGASRISFGPAPFIAAMAGLTEKARRVLDQVEAPAKAAQV